MEPKFTFKTLRSGDVGELVLVLGLEVEGSYPAFHKAASSSAQVPVSVVCGNR